MNFHLKRHRKLSEVLPVPDGLPELMSDIAREVLRYQPSNIEVFIADYLEAMVVTRELFYVSERTVDDILSQTVHLEAMMKKSGVSMEQSRNAIHLLMESVKHHSTNHQENIKELDIVNRLINELNFTVEQARKASEIIENVWCHYYNQNKNYVLKYKTEIDVNDAVQNTLTLHRRSDVSVQSQIKLREYLKKKSNVPENFDEENSKKNWKSPNFQNREHAARFIQSWYRSCVIRREFGKTVKAAVKIQAGFKGFKTRQEMQEKMSEARVERVVKNLAATKIQSWYRACKIRRSFKIEQKAAATIQAHFRGYLTRRNQSE